MSRLNEMLQQAGINWFLFIETKLRRKKNGTDYC